jgi:hypothetical protein
MELKPRRLLWVACATALALGAVAAHAGDYVLDIDGKTIELDLDHPSKVDLGNGKSVRLLLKQSREQTWRDGALVFKHAPTFSPSRRELGHGIVQTLMATPAGAEILVQHYDHTDPETMVATIQKALVEDEVGSGWKLTEKPTTRTLSDGTVLKGKIVHTTHATDVWDREIVAFGEGDGGYLVVSAKSDIASEPDHAMIALFWKSLSLKGAVDQAIE